MFGNSSGYLAGPVCWPWHVFLGLHRFYGHECLLDSPLSNVGRDVRNLNLKAASHVWRFSARQNSLHNFRLYLVTVTIYDNWCRGHSLHVFAAEMSCRKHALSCARSAFPWRDKSEGCVIWLAISFNITTVYTRGFLPRILVYVRYVWALSPYLDHVYTHF